MGGQLESDWVHPVRENSEGVRECRVWGFLATCKWRICKKNSLNWVDPLIKDNSYQNHHRNQTTGCYFQSAVWVQRIQSTFECWGKNRRQLPNLNRVPIYPEERGSNAQLKIVTSSSQGTNQITNIEGFAATSCWAFNNWTTCGLLLPTFESMQYCSC